MPADLSLAILLSASRGIVAVSAIFLVITISTSVPKKWRVFVATLLIAGAIGAVIEGVSDTKLFSANEESNAGKIGHVISFVDDLTAASFVFGRGLAHYYYSIGSGSMKAHTEITPVDMLRYFGFLFTLLLYFSIVFPSKFFASYRGEQRIYVFIFISYLALSFTNPIMFNSMGMLVILWYWAKIGGNKNSKFFVYH